MNGNDWSHLTQTPKDYIDKEVAHLRELRNGDKDEVKKQAVEYERRLSELNHSHDQAQEAFKTYVSLNVYTPAHEELAKQLETLHDELSVVKNVANRNKEDLARLGSNLMWITRTLVGAILVAAVAFVLRGLPVGTGPSMVP